MTKEFSQAQALLLLLTSSHIQAVLPASDEDDSMRQAVQVDTSVALVFILIHACHQCTTVMDTCWDATIGHYEAERWAL